MAYWRIRDSVAALGSPYGPKSGPGLTACLETLNSRHAAGVLLAHDRHRRLRHRLVGEEVELEALAQHLVGHLADPALPGRARIRHDDVDAAEALQRSPRTRVARCARSVTSQASAEAADLLGRRLGGPVVEVEHGHRGAFGRERLGRGAADAAAAARHHRHLARERLGHRALAAWPAPGSSIRRRTGRPRAAARSGRWPRHR